MQKHAYSWLGRVFLASATLVLAAPDDAHARSWEIGKLSGEVWVSGPELTPVALDTSFGLAGGHEIRTGRTGRVLLVRGEETIMISPNSVLALPRDKGSEGKTTILQRAGEIVLTVEKRTAPHFEVETPYLVALVKGTEFKVTIGPGRSQVDVFKGAVEVADFKTGQLALVLPGQIAKVAVAAPGLRLSGPGALDPIRQGTPRSSNVTRVPVPEGGLSKPDPAPSQQRAMLPAQSGLGQAAVARGNASATAPADDLVRRDRSTPPRIAQPIGQVRLDAGTATNGFARSGDIRSVQGKGNSRASATIFSTNELSPGNGAAKKASSGNSGGSNIAGTTNGSSANSGNAGGNGGGAGKGIAGIAAEASNGQAGGKGKGKGKGKGNSN